MPSYAITGASRGIGREYVRQLSQNPANTVLAIVRNPDTSKELKALAQNKGNVYILKANVADPLSILDAATQASGITGGTLDVLIHNAIANTDAGVALTPSQVPLDAQATEELFKPPIWTAVYGGLWVTNAFLPLIEAGDEKKIVHISSGMADMDVTLKTGLDSGVAYAVAKAGTNIQVAKYAVELAPKGIKVLALSPGWVDTWEAPGPKPPMVIAFMDALLKKFQRIDPTVSGQITPEESVKKQLEVIARLDDQMSGSFVGHRGDRRWV